MTCHLLRTEKFNAKADVHPTNKSSHSIFWQGVLVNVLNVKAVFFFLAFLPQFINPSKGEITTQIIFLSLLFVITAIVMGSIFVLISKPLRKKLLEKENFSKYKHYFSTAVYLILGVAIIIYY